LIREGKLDIYKVIPREKVNRIQESVQKLQSTSVSYLKEQLGSDFSFGEIRAVLAYAEISNK
jgi:ATP-dependent DNA helicase RecQ